MSSLPKPGTTVNDVICDVLDETIASLKANLDALTAQADGMTRDRDAVRAAERDLAALQIVYMVGSPLKQKYRSY